MYAFSNWPPTYTSESLQLSKYCKMKNWIIANKKHVVYSTNKKPNPE